MHYSSSTLAAALILFALLGAGCATEVPQTAWERACDERPVCRRERALVLRYGPQPRPSGIAEPRYREIADYMSTAPNPPARLVFQSCSDEPLVLPDRGWIVHCKYLSTDMVGSMVLNSSTFVIRNRAVVEVF